MRAVNVMREIKKLSRELAYDDKLEFRASITDVGRLYGRSSFGAVMLGLCNSNNVSIDVLSRLSEVIARYRQPLVNTIYYEICQGSDSELAFYSIAVKREGLWVRVPRGMIASSYLPDLRLKTTVYVISNLCELREWFSTWGGTAVITPTLFEQVFGTL